MVETIFSLKDRLLPGGFFFLCRRTGKHYGAVSALQPGKNRKLLL
jgi:hypothetical protein